MKIYVTYTWYGGGGFDGFNEFGPVFVKEEDAKKWEDRMEGRNRYHAGYDELEVYDHYIGYLSNDGKSE